MKQKMTHILVLTVSVLIIAAASCIASGEKGRHGEPKTAIVVASFGTTVPRAIPAIVNIVEQIRVAYPATEVRLSFTSNMIRSIWKKRGADSQKWLDQGVPKEVLYVKNIISTIGDLKEDGYKNIIVQPTHMFFMEQSHDLMQYVNALASIKTMKPRWRPFNHLVMGRPALGGPGDKYDYHIDVEAAVATLAGDAELARQSGAMLVYMGHGNEHWSTGIYQEFQKKMRKTYPDVTTYVGVVEGYPGLDDFMSHLKHGGSTKVILKPFMIVAGNHAVNDMAGPEESSWKSVLTREGYEVQAVMEGLGSNDRFARIFVDHIGDAAREFGLSLK